MASIFALAILANDHPVEFLGILQTSLTRRERGGDTSEHFRRSYVGILLKRLTDGQSQTPQRDMVWNAQVTNGTKQDGVEFPEFVQATIRDVLPCGDIPVTGPVEVGEVKGKFGREGL